MKYGIFVLVAGLLFGHFVLVPLVFPDDEIVCPSAPPTGVLRCWNDTYPVYSVPVYEQGDTLCNAAGGHITLNPGAMCVVDHGPGVVRELAGVQLP